LLGQNPKPPHKTETGSALFLDYSSRFFFPLFLQAKDTHVCYPAKKTTLWKVGHRLTPDRIPPVIDYPTLDKG
jgi:hypothetical protein